MNMFSENPIIKCRSRGGSCESIEDIECPQSLIVKEAMDCGSYEVCCILLN